MTPQAQAGNSPLLLITLVQVIASQGLFESWIVMGAVTMGKLWMMVCPGCLKTGTALGEGQVGVWAVLSCPLSEQDSASWEAREDPLASERVTDSAVAMR